MAGETNTKKKTTTSKGQVNTEYQPKGRSFGCSVCIYTFLFVAGIVFGTVLPNLGGHHFKQTYGKEYGVVLGQAFQDLPKHMAKLAQDAVVLGRDWADRFWAFKAEVDRRVEVIKEQSEKEAKTGSKTETGKTTATTQKSTTKTTTATTARTTTTTPKPTTTTTRTTTTTTRPTTTTTTTTRATTTTTTPEPTTTNTPRPTTTTTTTQSTTTTTPQPTTTTSTTTTTRPTTTTTQTTTTTTTPKPTTTTTPITTSATTTTQHTTQTTTVRTATTSEPTATTTTATVTEATTTVPTHTATFHSEVNHDHVHTVRAFDTTKVPVVVTPAPSSASSEQVLSGESQEKPDQPTPSKEL